ncbi:hypothetical protein IQ07DRAFT_103797 [Pyrenochaeta sp. DS3sAY3a]|nr:hypothetical protein IQ07DRAFT_103797 [Pyrenochaeta sp. DS3sAY3a]
MGGQHARDGIHRGRRRDWASWKLILFFLAVHFTDQSRMCLPFQHAFDDYKQRKRALPLLPSLSLIWLLAETLIVSNSPQRTRREGEDGDFPAVAQFPRNLVPAWSASCTHIHCRLCDLRSLTPIV